MQTICAFSCLGYRVVPASAPRVAAQETAYGEVQPFCGAVLAQGFDGVLRAGGREAARGRGERRDKTLVEAYGGNQQRGEQTFHTFRIKDS